ncbi:MAG: YfhO family protein [Chloroflexota bacterium]|nr:YfhO family protein [Chloroflexota bacterium]
MTSAVAERQQTGSAIAVGRWQGMREVGLLAVLPVLISFVMLWPALLGQGVLASTDLVTYDPFFGEGIPGVPPPLSANPMLNDPVDQMIPWRLYARSELRGGRFPLWNPYNAFGTPFHANYQSQVLSPFNFLWFVLPPVWGLGVVAALKWALMGLGMSLLLRRLGLGMPSAILGSVAAQLMGPITAWLQWPLSEALIWTPWLIFAALGWIETRRLVWLSAFGAIVAADMLAGHIESTFHVFVLAGAFILAEVGASKMPLKQKWLTLGGLLCAGVLGIGIAAAHFLPLLGILTSSWQWVLRENSTTHLTALPAEAALTLLSPNGFGWADAWYGPLNWLEINAYVGSLTLLLAAWGVASAIFSRRAPDKQSSGSYLYRLGEALSPRKHLFWVLVVAAGASMAYGIPPLSLLRNLPGFSSSLNFRMIVVADIGLIMLAAMGLQRLLEYRVPSAEFRVGMRRVGARYSALGALFFSLVGLLFLVDGVRVWFVASVEAGAYMQAWKMWAGVLFCAGAALILARVAGLLSSRALSVLAVVLLLLDLGRANWNWNVTSPLNTFYPSNGMTDFLSQRGITERVAINGYWADSNRLLAYRVPDVRYYDPLVANRYRAFMSLMSPRTFASPYPVHTIHVILDEPSAALMSLVGIKWLVTTSNFNPNTWQPVPQKGPIYTPWLTRNSFVAWENRYANAHAYLASRVRVVPDERAARQRLREIKLEEIREATVEHPIGLPAEVASASNDQPLTEAEVDSLRVIANIPGTVRVTLRTEKSRLLVVNESWSEGWRARVDGTDTPIYRVNYLMQGVAVPPGEHEVVFNYDPPIFKVGLVISGVSLLGWLGLLGLAVRQRRRGMRGRLESVGA